MTGINSEKQTELSPLDEEDKELTKEEHAVNFVKILAEIDRAMTPFKEHRSDLKRSYQENNWLSKAEMTDLAKAYRSLKSDEDLEKVVDFVKLLKDNNVKVG